MYSLLVCMLLVLYAQRQGNVFLGMLLLPSLFFYSLAYELKDSALSGGYFDFANISDYTLYIFFGLIQMLAVLVALNRGITGRARDLDPIAAFPSIFIRRAIALYYTLASVATAAFFINLSHVNFDISLLFLNPRVYEETFGQNTAVNYLYFLNIPALCLSIYLRQQMRRPRASTFIDVVLIFMSFFHGIKFTVFDTLLLPALFYFHCSRQPRRALYVLGLTLGVLLAFYLAFSLGVRGFYDDEGPQFSAVLNYILPNYYNFAYAIQLQPFQFDPIGYLLPDKIPNPFLSIILPGKYGFLLNDSFNMSTAYATIYAALPPLSWLFFTPLLVRLRSHVIRHKRLMPTLHSIFTAAYIDFCLFFFWYFFAFNKTKYVYYVVIMLMLGYVVHRRSVRRIAVN